MLIVTLSSIPPRFAHIGETLNSLLAQTATIERIIVYIPEKYRRFPDWDGSLPEIPVGVEIRRVKHDLGPATKVLAAVQDFTGQDVNILFCDDDRFYGREWASKFMTAARLYHGAAIAMRGLSADQLVNSTSTRTLLPRARHRPEQTDAEFQIKRLWSWLTRAKQQPERRLFKRSGYIDMFEGCAGVLIRPEFFDDGALDIPAVAWGVDDVWLSGMLAKNRIPIWLVANQVTPRNTAAQEHSPLAGALIDGAGRHQANCDAIRHMQDTYGVWLG